MSDFATSYLISDDFKRLDLPMIHDFLTHSYWAKGIPFDVVKKSIQNSWSFGLYQQSGEQVGFARFVTDHATFAYLADVFVLPAFQGKGLGKWFMAEIHDEPQLKAIRTLLLVTADAQHLYESVGYEVHHRPERVMAVPRDNFYRK